MKCEYHACQKDAGEKRYCSNRCNTSHYIHKKRRANKKLLIDFLGGKCRDCGYDRCMDALDFHHIKDKEFLLSSILAHNFEKLKKEADKCELLCKNCHAEHHAIEF